MRIRKIFQELCGFDPYPHQEEMANLLMRGESVLLRAPTGSGKSESVLIPFLIGEDANLPSQMVYSLPMRTLVDDISNRFSKISGNKFPNLRVVGHHGKRVESPLFYADIVVTTIDQTVGAYACTPLSLPVRHGNIPAGSVSSAFLVFDEVHTFEPYLGLQTTLILAEHSYKLNLPFVFMSATIPNSFKEYMVDFFGIEVVDAKEEDIKVRKERKILLHSRLDRLLDEKEIRSIYNSFEGKIIVVCNTVKKAQELYEQIKNYDCEVILLHSRFLENDRRKKEEELKTKLSEEYPSRVILISTQVIEVGLDISCNLMLTEVAPIDALIQRAGRCARRGGKGHVFVYNVENASPYDRSSVELTKEKITEMSEKRLDWEKEKKLVDEILDEKFRQYLEPERGGEILNQLARGAFFGDRKQVEESVRSVLSCEVALHDTPDILGLDIFRLPKINVHIGILKKFLKEKNPIVWRVEIDELNEYKPQVKLIRVMKDADIYPYGFYIIHPDYASYNDHIGLSFEFPGTPMKLEEKKERIRRDSKLMKESWIEHAVKTLEVFRETVLPSYEYSLKKINDKWKGIPEEEFLWKIEVCILLHDLGKLNINWQKRIKSEEEPLAHSGSDMGVNLPPHATVSAYALSNILFDWGRFGDMLKFALAHHHSVRASYVPKYCLIPTWGVEIKKINKCFEEIDLDFSRIIPRQNSPTELDQFPLISTAKYYRTYCLVSRLLRLSDRIATAGDENAILRYEEWYGNV